MFPIGKHNMAINLSDITANNNNLTNSGAAEVTTSLPFATSTIAVDLVKTESDFLWCNDSASLSFNSDFTLECWVNFTSIGSDAATTAFCMMSKYQTSTAIRSWEFDFINITGTKSIRLNVSNDGSSSNRATWSWTPTVATWYHLAVAWTKSSGSATLYVDGASQGAVSTGATTIYDGDAKFAIGASSEGAGNYIDGKIDDVRVWNDIRTPTEIADNMSRKILQSDNANLAAYWPFETGWGTPTVTGGTLRTLTGVGN
jgi:hypothetical protein